MRPCILIAAMLFASLFGQGQVVEQNDHRASNSFDGEVRGDNELRVVFYNVENLFDSKDDSLTRDDEFTEEGERHYDFGRYKEKTEAIARTLVAIGGWEPAGLIGLCEVENRYVLEGLIEFNMLEEEYRIIHEDSDDRRGIDVAAIYRPDKFELLYYEYIKVDYPPDSTFITRDILHIAGILLNGDTLHAYFNHWPSRWGGQFNTQPMRRAAASTLRKEVDRVMEKYEDPRILIAGDLNDHPSDLSVEKDLRARAASEVSSPSDLINLMKPIEYNFGTHSYAGEWSVLDHLIISQNLADTTNSTHYEEPGAIIFDAEWLLKKNAAGNSTSNRFYQGPIYMGGYSDHLPIYLDLSIKKPRPKKSERGIN